MVYRPDKPVGLENKLNWEVRLLHVTLKGWIDSEGFDPLPFQSARCTYISKQMS